MYGAGNVRGFRDNGEHPAPLRTTSPIIRYDQVNHSVGVTPLLRYSNELVSAS